MKLGIVLSTTEPERMFNALRLGSYATHKDRNSARYRQ